jgi:solute carrier family 25 folate transporter 32
MLHREGLKSLYKGLGPTLLGLVPNWAVYFVSYEASKDFFRKYLDSKPIYMNMCSAVTAGATTATVTSPFWVIRTRMQTQITTEGGTHYRNTFHAFKSIYKNEGFRGFYRGLASSYFGLVHVAVQFPLYEYFKQKLRKDKPNLTFMDIVIASSVSKLIASVAAYPHEVLRSRFQDYGHGTKLQVSGRVVKYESLIHAVRTIWKEEGFFGFYRGMAVNLVRVVPAAIITLSTYEFCSRNLTKLLSREEQIHFQRA